MKNRLTATFCTSFVSLGDMHNILLLFLCREVASFFEQGDIVCVYGGSIGEGAAKEQYL